MTVDLIRSNVYNLEDMLGITRVRVSDIKESYKRGNQELQVLTSSKFN